MPPQAPLNAPEVRVGEDLAGDAFSIEVVGLALAAPEGLLSGASRAHVADIEAGLTEEDRGVAAGAEAPSTPHVRTGSRSAAQAHMPPVTVAPCSGPF